jgi:Fe-S-cluster containining protein
MLDAAGTRHRAALEQVTSAGLAAARGEEDVAALLRAIDAVVTGELATRASQPVACGPGCASCCSINVGTLAVEGAVAAAYLRHTVARGELELLAARLTSFHANVRWLEDRERVRGAFRCPFLDARRACRIHPVRPLACRGVTSLDAAECRAALSPLDEDDPPLVRMSLHQKALYDEAFDVLRAAVEARGLDGRCRDVSGMTAIFLSSPALLGGYLAGASLPLA